MSINITRVSVVGLLVDGVGHGFSLGGGGITDGDADGQELEYKEGSVEGVSLFITEGIWEGRKLGVWDGITDGVTLGTELGGGLGPTTGESVGLPEPVTVAVFVGPWLGTVDG